MARTRPPDRLEHVLESATHLFIHRGYRRTQMADVARASGLAPGTLYLYFKSKRALFNTVVRRAFLGDDFEPPVTLPVPSPSKDALLGFIRERYTTEWRLHALEAALKKDSTSDIIPDARAEFEGVVRELYFALHTFRHAIRVVERSSDDWPALYELHFETMRRHAVDQLIRYVDLRTKQHAFPPVVSAAAAAGVVLESVSWFAMHRHFARHSDGLSDDAARETVVQLLVAAFNPDSSDEKR